ncbi:hypothetical protein DNX69_00040 [Rhodopseudomonas palustris]|uniref:Uncharacterized protein n=1 Tax=Rhodopseudomonas palustris TaxID=1076 RepID=A0A323UNE2_RHOPL|nr:hypothetical protein [Rhodopseudomonas palustris]PZA13871.1 hypothetical protein DNX69_00040 [Rhodopseudomonas palustris]
MTETIVFHLNAAEAEIIRRRRAQIAEDELRRILRENSPLALAAIDRIMSRPCVGDESFFDRLATVLKTEAGRGGCEGTFGVVG